MVQMPAPLTRLQNMLSRTWLPNRNALLLVLGQRLLYLKRVPWARAQYRRRCQPPAMISRKAALRRYIGTIQSARRVEKLLRSPAPGCRYSQVSAAIAV